jgi:hypothetical protein
MYRLNTQITFDDGLHLEQPEWFLSIIADDIPNQRVHVNVTFSVEGARQSSRPMLIYDYSEAGTWEDADLYQALLAMPELANSSPIN